MKNLLFIIGLLLTLNLYCFDTLILDSRISSVQITPNGTKVSNQVSLSAQQGSYVVKLRNIPSTVEKDKIEFTEVDGLFILHIDLVKTDPLANHHKNSYHHLNDEIDSAYVQLKSLEKAEKELLEEKKTIHEKDLVLSEIESLQEYYHRQGNTIKKERQAIFKRLSSLRENNRTSIQKIRQAVPKFNATKNTLFISITLIDSSISSISWNYLLPSNPEKRYKAKEEWMSETDQNLEEDEELPPYVIMKGKVMDLEHNAPMIFATIECYQNGQLFQTTTTDDKGEYRLKLATLTPYEMVVSFEGYKKKKIKNIIINRPSLPEHITTMRVKEKITVVEIVAYTLPILDLARSFIK